jgi:hypothetical protein
LGGELIIIKHLRHLRTHLKYDLSKFSHDVLSQPDTNF